jgi:hypothetical protein
MRKLLLLLFVVTILQIEAKQDWMIMTKHPKTQVEKINNSQIKLTNQFLSRTFNIDKSGTTVAYDNLQTGESIIRSVRPEALLTIDGNKFQVGGLQGQPIHNYLHSDWLKNMSPVAEAIKFVSYQVEDIKERFPWKRRKEWMALDMPWPAKGKTLTLKYKVDDEFLKNYIENMNIDKLRKKIVDDKFVKLSSRWNAHLSKASDRSSIINEGKPGEIMGMENTSVYAEQKVEKGTKVVIAKLNPGTDKSKSNTMGISLVFADKTIKFAMQHAHSFTIFDGEKIKKINKKEKFIPYWMRVEFDNSKLKFSASKDNKTWIDCGTLDYDGVLPQLVRVGKTDKRGFNSDAKNVGERVRCHIESFSQLGEVKEGVSPISKLGYLKDLEIDIHFNLYDGIPLLAKWLTVKNGSKQPVTINSFTSELLAAVEPRNQPTYRGKWVLPNITVQTDYDCGGGMQYENGEGKAYRWKKDSKYLTQINYGRKNPCLLEVKPEYGPSQTINKGETFETYKVWELIHDSRDKERKGLQIRKMMRVIAPWILENPIMVHVRNGDNKSVKHMVDQCAELGFEKVILTFGSGVNVEDESKENLDRMKMLADYAHSKDITLGTYSLLASRRVIKGNNVVMPKGMRPRFGNSPCVCSKWGEDYFRKLYKFYNYTGQDNFEHDGSYPGDICASTEHVGHKGIEDSRWNQFRVVRDFYRWCRSKGIFLNIPDWYFLNGGNKVGMGYRETNWSLPRKQQEIIERQNIFDGTFFKTPTMGWMHVPLVQYHGGGAAATYQPLHKHLDAYEVRLANLFGNGVQAAWRGKELYDTEETKAIVKKWVNHYKKYRDILDSDIIHVRRADGRDYDGMLHVNPALENKALFMVYNPTDKPIKKTISLPLYYTGLDKVAKVAEKDNNSILYKINRDYSIDLEINIPAYANNWYVIK